MHQETSDFDSRPQTQQSGGGSRRGFSRFALWVLVVAAAFVFGSRWQGNDSRPVEPQGLVETRPITARATQASNNGSGNNGITQALLTQPRYADLEEGFTEDERRTINLFRNASPSVVYIDALQQVQDRFRMRVLEVPNGSGSGFVWDEDGHVVTNYHVVAGRSGSVTTRIKVTLNDGSEWNAEYVGGEPNKDVAVLKIDAPKRLLEPIRVGTSGNLVVGQSVYAIGNPFGLDYTLTTGVVSALGREIESLVRTPIKDVIQTDAAINPGNSGGPLLDSGGRLIGVNTQIYSPSGASAGIGFAIPIDTVNWVVDDLIRYGRVQRPQIGIVFFDNSFNRQYRLRGAAIRQVVEGTGAEEAGLKGPTRTRRGIALGDVITALDGKAVESPRQLPYLLEDYKPGDVVELTIQRSGRDVKVPVRLSEPR